jgi:hypothetical protein
MVRHDAAVDPGAQVEIVPVDAEAAGHPTEPGEAEARADALEPERAAVASRETDARIANVVGAGAWLAHFAGSGLAHIPIANVAIAAGVGAYLNCILG